MRILVTGGAGFIGSNLVEALLKEDRVSFVRVLDDLSTGFERNILEFYSHPKFQFIKGDIRDFDTCLTACTDIDLISHQAALGSVPRSIEDPLTANAVNVNGSLNIFTAAKTCSVRRIVFAASSSTYGDNSDVSKKEDRIGKPLSPYAVTKYVNELYADVFASLYGIEYVGLRYFNVFGPKQDPSGAYAAVIPLFIKAALQGKAPTINGDGTFSRDFTYIANVVQANKLALFASSNTAFTKEGQESINQIYNVAYGERTTLNELWEHIQKVVKIKLPAIHGPSRLGDIPHSLADISKAKKRLKYQPDFDVETGLKLSYQWYENKLVSDTISTN